MKDIFPIITSNNLHSPNLVTKSAISLFLTFKRQHVNYYANYCLNRCVNCFRNIANFLSVQNCAICFSANIPDSHTADNEIFSALGKICTNCTPRPSTSINVNRQILYNAIHGIQMLGSIWYMEDEVESIIKAFKYSKTPILGILLGKALANYLNRISKHQSENSFDRNDYMHRWDLIIPVPSMPKNERMRGFSHTAIIVRSLAKSIKIPHSLTSLRSLNAAKRQAQLKISERESYIVDRFYVIQKNRLRGLRILLVDDTITTGATLSEVACVLHACGVLSVDALTLARS